MIIKRVQSTEIKDIQKELVSMTQVFPIYQTLSKAKEHIHTSILQNISSEDTYFVIKKNHIIGFLSLEVTNESLLIKNFLLQERLVYTKGMTYWLDFFCGISKKIRKKYLQIMIYPVNQWMNEKMLELHFSIKEVGERINYQKQMDYHTALVLAGGGARGAYQIGAWKALRELGITFSIICGTSVGALNGSLILQGDLKAAEKMWKEIDTGKILSFPGETNNAETLKGMLTTIQSFAHTALTSLGVSTEPLKELIKECLTIKDIFQSEEEFFLVTTQLPAVKEVVISLKNCSQDEFAQWLLATASFFPAMKTTKIRNEYYVDGGYKNNIPVDIALKAGATELVVVDVKGPGVTKSVSIPETIPLVTISSPWSLGTVLLFDGNRSSWNMQLGYLETLKQFGKFVGYWYTFYKSNIEIEMKTLQKEMNCHLAKEVCEGLSSTKKRQEIQKNYVN